MIDLKKKVAVYGVGNNFREYSDFISRYLKPVVCIDQNKNLNATEVLPGVRCTLLEELDSWNVDVIVITIQDKWVAENVKKELEYKYEVYFLVELYDEFEVEQFENFYEGREKNLSDKLMHFACGLGSSVCNMGCSYCYVDFADPKLKHNSYFSHSIEFILKALSPERLGSCAYFSMCSDGETMLKPGIIELTYGLLMQGHYVGLITNGTVTEKVKRLIEFPEELRSRLLVQNSMHFDELKKKNLLDVYFDNINSLRRSGISVNATMPGSDEDIENIPEIKELCMSRIGFLPMISPIRGERWGGEYEGFPLGSKYTWEEYVEIWKDFDSPSIKCRKHTLNHIDEICFAGMHSGYINIQTGDLLTCVPGKKIANIYKDITQEIPFLEEPNFCPFGFCSHNGYFLSGREINGAVLPTLYEFHNRYDKEGKPTFGEKIRKAMDFICDY